MPPTAVDTNLEPPEVGGGYRAEALVSFVRLRWFIHLRWVMAGLLWTFLLAEYLLEGRLNRPMGLVWTLVGLVVLNLLWWVLSHALARQFDRRGDEDVGAIRVAGLFANAQITLDLLFLTVIIHYTGGIENPMAIFYLFHMAIASLLLPAAQAFMQGGWAFLLYLLLGIAEYRGWLAHHEVLHSLPPVALHSVREYVWLLEGVVGSGIFGTLYFTQRIASRLDERERVLRSVNRALRESQAAIQELQRRKAQFMRTAAHQLKSPLAVIQTQIHLLRDTQLEETTRNHIYDKIITRCQVAIGQVHDLLTFARVQEADVGRHKGAATNIAQLVRDLCDRYQPAVDRKHLDLYCDIPQNGDWTVHVESTDLADAVGNLIENAIKYTESPGDVSVKVAKRDRAVAVTVQDSGMGMTPETQVEMFDAYRRGNLALEKGILGSGLGLSIVRAVVEQAAGQIIVKSRPGEGSSFTLVFPTAQSSAETPGVGGATTSVVRIE